MNDLRLQAEIWEIQVILYWILDVLIFKFTNLYWLGWIVLVWSFISFLGIFGKLYKAQKKNEEGKRK